MIVKSARMIKKYDANIPSATICGVSIMALDNFWQVLKDFLSFIRYSSL